MSQREQRQHVRIDDQIYFNYKVIHTGTTLSSSAIMEDLLGTHSEKYFHINEQFQSINKALSQSMQVLAHKDPLIAECLDLLNTKLECLAQSTFMSDKLFLRTVDLSLGGMAFRTTEKLIQDTQVQLVIYTRPHMVPIFIESHVVYSQYIKEKQYRTALQFTSLTPSQEKLLMNHIMQAQTTFNAC